MLFMNFLWYFGILDHREVSGSRYDSISFQVVDVTLKNLDADFKSIITDKHKNKSMIFKVKMTANP